MPRPLRYQVAMSLDGFIAGPRGEYDWIPADPDIDFAAIFEQFDTAIMGRKTFQTTLQQGGDGSMPGLQVVVFSATFASGGLSGGNRDQHESGRARAIAEGNTGQGYLALRRRRTAPHASRSRQVDTIEPAVVPVILGDGIPMLSPPLLRTQLTLSGHHLYPKSGIMLLQYTVAETSRP
jgi:dihydrofolate reductase